MRLLGDIETVMDEKLGSAKYRKTELKSAELIGYASTSKVSIRCGGRGGVLISFYIREGRLPSLIVRLECRACG